jgi:hypothetical protein
MKTKYRFRYLLLIMIYCQASGCGAQEDEQTVAWQPDVRSITTNSILWGPETNHVKIGLNLQYGTDTNGRTLVGFYVSMVNDSNTNGTYLPDRLTIALPPMKSRYQMNLFDDSGNSVSKTKTGQEFSQPFDKNPKRLDMYHGYSIKETVPFQIDIVTFEPIVLENYFAITNAGKYHLVFILNSLIPNGNSVEPLYLPVDADIEIKKP